MLRRFLPFLALLLLSGRPALSWWETGHKVVARIAAAGLTPAARTRVARILGVADTPEAVAQALADGSIWADQTKAQTGTAAWHFIDFAIQDHRSDEEERCPGQNCLPARIQLFEEQLKEHPNAPGTDPRWTEADALRYLVHFLGDAHQPLHAATDDDQGGNCELLTTPFQTAKNLHALWDGGIIGAMQESDVELAEDLEKEIEHMHDRQRRHLIAGDERDWIWESHELALKDIYGRLHIPVEPPQAVGACTSAPQEIQAFHVEPDPAYVEAMKPVIRMQLIKGGLRLAKVLNETL